MKALQGIRADIQKIQKKISMREDEKENYTALHDEYYIKSLASSNIKEKNKFQNLASRYLSKINHKERQLNALRNRLQKKESIYKRLSEKI